MKYPRFVPTGLGKFWVLEICYPYFAPDGAFVRFWLRLQDDYDLEKSEHLLGEELEEVNGVVVVKG